MCAKIYSIVRDEKKKKFIIFYSIPGLTFSYMLVYRIFRSNYIQNKYTELRLISFQKKSGIKEKSSELNRRFKVFVLILLVT